MSDLLDSAAAALGVPASLAQRSAAARAAETGASVDDILAAWAGGAPPPSAPTTTAADSPTPAEPPPAAAPPAAAPSTDKAPATAAPAQAPAAPVVPVIVYEEAPGPPLDPAPIGRRVGVAARVGAWTGAGLGLAGFLIASAFWSDAASVAAGTGPVTQVSATAVLVGAALIGLLFGAIVAGLSRAVAAWANPAMQLRGSKASTAWVGAVVGLVLALLAGSVLIELGAPIEGGDETLTHLPVLAALAVMIIGGGALGAAAGAVPQLFGTPIAVDDSDLDEVAEIKGRLGSAVGVPAIGAALLLLLVLPFAYILIRSNEAMSGAAALIAIVVAAGVLGFATLAGSQPEMKISLADALVALAGIGTVLIIIVAVVAYNSSEEETDPGAGDTHAAVVVQTF